MNEYFTLETISTFGGMVAAVMLIVQVTKGVIISSGKFPDGYVRLYALIWAFILQGVLAYINYVVTPEVVLLAFLNALVVTAAAMGAYEVVSDPKGER